MGILSMTAFGSAAVEATEAQYTCDVRTLNSRYLEVNVRLPRFLLALETEIIRAVKQQLSRGKVDVSINVQLQTLEEDLPQLQESAVQHYVALAEKIGAMTGSNTPLRPSDCLRLEGVLAGAKSHKDASKLEAHKSSIMKALDTTLSKVKEERAKEGAALDQAFRDLLGELESERQSMQALCSDLQQQIYANYLKKIHAIMQRLEDSGLRTASEIPEERLLQEVSILTDKSDIAEELTRLDTHIVEFGKLLGESEPTGRKLDFLCQEMHREVNTMSSKISQTDASKHTRHMKQTIERMRQQVQNIE